MPSGLTWCLLLLLAASTPVYGGATRTYTVAGPSMLPALAPGDRVVVAAADEGALRRGDLVAIRLGVRHHPVVKRVAATAGDRLEIRGDVLCVNGAPLGPFDAARWRSTVRQLERFGGIVPAGSLFVLGDNPANSRDSRRLGLIPVEHVAGRVVRVIRPQPADGYDGRD